MRAGITFAIGKRQLVICKRCGCPDLAWAQSKKTGRSYLVKTYVASDDGRHRTLAANKMAYHNCEEYKREMAQVKFEQTLRANQELHPKANDPGSILVDVFKHALPSLSGDDKEEFMTLISEAANRIAAASRRELDHQQQPSRYGKCKQNTGGVR